MTKLSDNKLSYFTFPLCLLMFNFSGMFKWVPLPIDLTILMFALLVLIIASRLLSKGITIRLNDTHLTVALFTFFFIYYLISLVYTSSEVFWRHKALVNVLNFLSFVFPIVCFTHIRYFQNFAKMLTSIGLVSACVVHGFYWSGNIDYLLNQGFDKELSKIPDYLVLGASVGYAILILSREITMRNSALVLFCLLALFVLGARGPLIFTVLVMFFSYLTRPRQKKAKRTGFTKKLLLLSVIAVIAFTLTNWQGAERTILRLSSMTSLSATKTFRVEEFGVAFQLLKENPVFGVGIGGFGKTGFDLDEDIYPHNLILEALAELGMLGGLLFCFLIFWVFRVAYRVRHERYGQVLFVCFAFCVLNFMKSSGFISARSFFMFCGVVIAYMNLHYCESRSLKRSILHDNSLVN